jgi:N-acetylglucosamine-6-sulfatase
MPRIRALLVVLAAVAIGVVAVSAAGSRPGAAHAAHGRPNFIVIMTDDETYRDMAAMPATRNLIGAAGATFTQSYVSYPLCCPSRATYLTGQYAHNHGVRSTVPPDGGVEALNAAHTLPVWLSKAGYDTIHIGKYLNGYGLRRRPTVPPGWTDWHGAIDKSTYQMWGYKLFENGVANTYGDFDTPDPALHQTDVLRDKALDAIRAHADGKTPYFLSLMFVAPHGEVVRPGTSTEPHIRPAPRHAGAFSTLPLPRDPAFDEADVTDKPPEVSRLDMLRPAVDERILRDFRSRRESLLAVDEAVAAIVAELERSGQLDSTYLLFTSDNGFFQGEHRLAKGKYLAYDASTRVPLLLRGPGIPAGTVSGELVANTDLAPTILDATGASADLPEDGRSLLPFARDGSLRSERPILHEGLVGGDADRDAGARTTRVRVYYAIRTRRYLYVKWRGGARELYDLRRDPFELRSRHRDPRYAAIAEQLSFEVKRLRHCVGEECGAPVEPLQPTRRTGDVPSTAPAASSARTAT